MKNLKESLQNLVDQFLVDCVISDRCTGGYNLTFHNIIPSDILGKMIAFCTLYDYSYYLSAGFNSGDLIFSIYRQL